MLPTMKFRWSFITRFILSKQVLLPVIAVVSILTKINGQHIDIDFIPPTTNTVQGGNFQVIVRAHFLSANPLNAIETHFTFDNTKLQATAITNLSAAILPTLAIAPSFNNIAGTVDFAAGTFGALPTSDFNLYSVDFNVLPAAAPGTTTLAFNTASTLAAGPGGIDILNSTINGSVVITGIGCTAPLVTISAPGGTTTCNSQPFNLILASVTDGTGPFDLTIEGPDGTATYNNIAVGSPITTFTPPVQSVWSAAAPSPFPATSEDAAYTLGMKFTSSVAGFVKGVRFFSAGDVSAVPGNYTGQLWDQFGALLASGTFTGVTFDSWQELIFDEPVLITPGTVYVASYNTGTFLGYASTANGLAADVVNGPLTTLAGGVYNQGSAVTFPGVPTSGGTTPHNYWVDVIFSPNEYTFNLTSIKDALECVNAGSLQTLSVTSVDCATLPVSLLNLSATPKDNSILLTWSTASEINNKGFEIQRRTETGNWSALGFVNGAGSSSNTHNYNYSDDKLSSGKYYYRLKQIDIDGRFEFSPVLSAVIGGSQKFSLDQNFPNPFRGETIVRFTLPERANVKLMVFDMHGRMVKTLVSGSREKGTHAITVNSTTLTCGLYYYKLETENFSAVKKMTIQ